MFRWMYSFAFLAHVLDELGWMKKKPEYDELAHFHRLYKWRKEQGDDIPQWVHDIYDASLMQHVPLTDAVRELMNRG